MRKFKIDNSLHSTILWFAWAFTLAWFVFGFFYVSTSVVPGEMTPEIVGANRWLARSALGALGLSFVFGVWLFLRLLLYKQNLLLENEHMLIPQGMRQVVIMLYEINHIEITSEEKMQLKVVTETRTCMVKFLYQDDFRRFCSAEELKRFFPGFANR